MEWLLFALLAVACIWWLVRNKKIQAAQQFDSLTDNVHPPVLEPPLAEALGPSEIEARRARESFEAAQTEWFQTDRSKLDTIRDSHAKIAKARELIQASMLDEALPYVLERTQYWPSWIRNQTPSWLPPLPVTEIDGARVSSINNYWVQFRPNGGSLFRMEFDRSRMPPDGDNEFAKMKLSADGDEVLCIGVVQNWNKEFENWRFCDVDCLRVGPWMSQFVAFYGQLHSVNTREQEDRMQSFYVKRAERIDLGDQA